jgi:hypothetical protein
MKGAVRRILRGSCCWWLIRERSRVVLKYGSPASVCYSRTAALHFSSLYLEVILENYKDLKKSQSPMNLFNSDSLTPFHFPKKKLHCFSMTERWCKTTRLAYLASRRSQVQSPQHSPLFIYSHEVCNKNNLWFYIYDRNSSFPRCSPPLRACHPPPVRPQATSVWGLNLLVCEAWKYWRVSNLWSHATKRRKNKNKSKLQERMIRVKLLTAKGWNEWSCSLSLRRRHCLCQVYMHDTLNSSYNVHERSRVLCSCVTRFLSLPPQIMSPSFLRRLGYLCTVQPRLSHLTVIWHPWSLVLWGYVQLTTSHNTFEDTVFKISWPKLFYLFHFVPEI